MSNNRSHQDTDDSSEEGKDDDDDDGDSDSEEMSVKEGGMCEEEQMTEEAGPSSFNCRYCPTRFINEELLRQHVNDVHPHRRDNNQCQHCSYHTTNYYGKIFIYLRLFSHCNWDIYLELLDHLRVIHSNLLDEARTQRLQGRKSKRTYRINTGRPKKSFMKSRIEQRYFDINMLSTEEGTERIINNPTLCVGEALDAYRNHVIRPYIQEFFNHHGSIRFSIQLRVVMEKALRYTSDDEQIAHFNSFSLELPSMRDFNQIYNSHSQKIHQEFNTFTVNGSGWTIKNITGCYVKIAVHRPFRGGTNVIPSRLTTNNTFRRPIHLQVPDQIRNSGCVVNLNTSDDMCFKYSILCAIYYMEIKAKNLRPNNISSYKPYLEKINFDGIKFPVKLHEKAFKKFEENNTDFALNILTIQTNILHPTLGRRTKTRNYKTGKKKALNIHCWRTSPFLADRFPIYLLLLYNPRTSLSHFTTVTKLNVLLAHNSPVKTYKQKKICMECRTSFSGVNCQRNYNIHFRYCKSRLYTRNLTRTSAYRNLGVGDRNKSFCLNCHTYYEDEDRNVREQHLKKHQKYCLVNPPALIKIPTNTVLTFNNYKKQREKPFRIYSDTESVLANLKVKCIIDGIIKEYKKEHFNNANTHDSEDEDEDNLNLEMFSDEDECDEDINHEDQVRDYNIEVDDTEIPAADPPQENHTLHNHEISGFSFNIVTYPHLQKYFLLPLTYSGVHSGKVNLCNSIMLYYVLQVLNYLKH